jgi:hypothetical protein
MRRTEDEKLRRKMRASRGVRSVAEEWATALPRRALLFFAGALKGRLA